MNARFFRMCATGWFFSALFFQNPPFAFAQSVHRAQHTDAQYTADDQLGHEAQPERTLDIKPGERPTNLDKIEEAQEQKLQDDSNFWPRRKTFRLVAGVTFRGVIAEAGDFDDKLGFEFAMRFFERLDIGAAIGQLFKEGARIQPDVRSRFFLLPLPTAGGPYLGMGYLFSNRYAWYGTLGLFGGSGLFFELQFRESERQPLAVVPSLGLRISLY